MAWLRFRGRHLIVAAAALVVMLASSALLQRGGVAQHWAMAVSVPAGLLTLYPAIRGKSGQRIRLAQWSATVAAVTAISLVLHVLLLSIG